MYLPLKFNICLQKSSLQSLSCQSQFLYLFSNFLYMTIKRKVVFFFNLKVTFLGQNGASQQEDPEFEIIISPRDQ